MDSKHVIFSDRAHGELEECTHTHELVTVLVDFLSKDERFDFADKLLEHESQDFIRPRIDYETAIDVVASQDADDVAEDLGLTPVQLSEAIADNIDDITHIIVMDHPDTATALLKELKYWEQKGRI